jgi:Na+/glutamate symporter
MSATIINIIIQLIASALGGHGAGAALKPIFNSANY